MARCPLSLSAQASALSGVPASAALALSAAQPSVYERLGEPALRRLASSHYERVFGDTEPLRGGAGAPLRAAFAHVTRAEASHNLALFLVERCGGPPVFTRERGTPALVGRHGPYAACTREAAERWLQHMDAALDELLPPEADAEGRAALPLLRNWLHWQAFFIVEGRLLLNPSRLVGYGGSVHDGRA